MSPSDNHSTHPPSLKVVFAGSPAFAACALQGLLDSSHQVVAVYTQPDRPAGRGLKLQSNPVKTLALAHQLPVEQPKSLKDSDQISRLRDYDADVMVVAAYGLLLPHDVLSSFRLGCINIHPSLLPRWRGAAPIQRTIYAGDTISGVTIMQMDQGLDTGPILLKREYVLDPEETTLSLTNELAKLAGQTIVAALDQLASGHFTATPQMSYEATYAHKIVKEEALIDWQESALQLERQIRAFNPWPIAYTSWQGGDLRIWQARALPEQHHSSPRTILKVAREGVDIATGEGILRLLKVQLAGGKPIGIADFVNARKQVLKVGEHFL